MNEAQRNVLVRTLWVVAVAWAVLLVLVFSTDGLLDSAWHLLVPPVAIVAALYLRAGGRKTE